jgi:transmembrane sensor
MIEHQSFKKYIEGTATEKEASDIREILSTAGKEVELEDKSFQFWNEIPGKPEVKEYDSAGILDKVYHQIKISETVFVNRVRPIERVMSYLTRVAAIMLIPASLTALVLYFKIAKPAANVSYAEIFVPIGTRTTFSLPDGSSGWINGGSSLKFPNDFTENIRKVELTGEAYFNVAKNKEKAFIVSTKNIDIKVFGTSFNVMAYADEALTEVTLESGSVEVFKKNVNKLKSIGVLEPNQAIIYNNISDSQVIIPIYNAERTSWMQGILVFKYEPFIEVIRRINRWYNVNIVIRDKSLNSYSYYGTFKDESLDEVLNLLKRTAPIGYRDLGRIKKPDNSFEKRKIEIFLNAGKKQLTKK